MGLRQRWLTVAVPLTCVIVGAVTGALAGLELVIWLFEGGELRSMPGNPALLEILGLAIGAGVAGRFALWASVELLRKLGGTEQEIWGTPDTERKPGGDLPGPRARYWPARVVFSACVIVFGLGGLLTGVALSVWLLEGGNPLGWLGSRALTWPEVIAGIIGTIGGILLGLWAGLEVMRKIEPTEDEGRRSPTS